MLIVQKYGGSSLADETGIRRAAARAAEAAARGLQVVVVVSAQGSTTDRLIEKAAAVNPEASPRELDALLSAGEQMSAALMAMAIEACGCSAVSLTGWQAGICTDGTYENARVLSVDTGRIRRELNMGRVVVAAGFQGICQDGNITTLGRGGSDTTAVVLAAFLHADRCQIFTDVDGVYDRDPRCCADARKLDSITYDGMAELIRQGAQVLHSRSVEFAKKYGLRLEVLSSVTGDDGTVVAD